MRKLYVLFLLVFCIITAYGQRAPRPLNDSYTITRLDSVGLTPLSNDSNFVAGDTVCLTQVYGGHGWASVADCKHVSYQQTDRGFYGRDTFFYVSCYSHLQPTLCDTGRVFMTIRPRANNDTILLMQYDSLWLRLMDNDSNKVVGDSLCLSSLLRTTTSRAGWSVLRGCDSVKYKTLNAGYWGLDTFRYKACSRKIPTLCDTGTVIVNLYFPPKVFDDSATLTQPDTVSVRLQANDSVYIVTDSICVTSVYGPAAAWARLYGCDSLTFHPTDFHNSGDDTLYYVSCYTTLPDKCDTASLIVKVTLPLPGVDFTYEESAHCLTTAQDASVLSDSVHWEVTYISGNGTDTTWGNTNLIKIQATPDSAFQAEVCLTAYNPSGDTTICYTFWIECIGSGVHDLDIAAINVYPNPANDAVNIDLSQAGAALSSLATIEISDLTGRILKREVAKETIHLSVSDLGSGLYLLGCTDQTGTSRGIAKLQVIH
ncbi:MAG: T9SS type A sorting domain-containing protein [Bacteroidetes bacterium]|nr:T9SS type A sorting domain-containing protein [Bacteroidota bacterium]